MSVGSGGGGGVPVATASTYSSNVALVDDDVHHRRRCLPAGGSGDSGEEDRHQCVGVTLAAGGLEHHDGEVVTMGRFQRGPRCAELGLLEAGQDLGDLGVEQLLAASRVGARSW